MLCLFNKLGSTCIFEEEEEEEEIVDIQKKKISISVKEKKNTFIIVHCFKI